MRKRRNRGISCKYTHEMPAKEKAPARRSF